MKLVIVESPTKAKTISKFLGKAYAVESSFGHIRDLPKSKMGIDIESGTFEPHYIVSKDKTAQVKKLKDLAKKATEVIFATDEDREGEAISWHLAQILDVDPKKAKRIVFHEITEHAIKEALDNPRHIDQKLVDAQQARRILDRLVGYELSPFLWKKVARGLSAGRVQSVAVRLVVDREREIQKFVAEEYWSLEGIFSATKKENEVKAMLHARDGKKIDKFELNSKEKMDEVLASLQNTTYSVSSIEQKEAKRTPPAPYTTSTLQQSANQKLGYSSKQTMVLAQQLYEGVNIGTGHVGLITYMRTDSMNLADKFLGEAKQFIHDTYGKEFGLATPRKFKTKSKGAQEAHEAIRPSDPTRTPESLSSYLDPKQLKLYTLIWKRTLATQMSEARINKTTLDITSKNNYTFRANGQSMIFPGWLALYPEAMKEEMLPEVKEGETMNCKELKPEQHFTEPPARYSDATIVKAMEEYGIGRPSTYAPTLANIEDRYVERDDNKRFKPKDIAFIVNDLLVDHFTSIVDYAFTAQMEENLDDIAEGKEAWQPIIATFYHPFHETIVQKGTDLSKESVVSARELGIDPKSQKPISVRIGRFGPFVQKGTKDDEIKPIFASIPKQFSADTITLEQALSLLQLPKVVGQDEEGNDMTVAIGRFGPYVKVGSKFYSLKTDDPYTITFERAKEVIAEAKDKESKILIKTFPGSDVVVKDGRYGPYITNGKANAKIPKGTEPTDLDLATCEQLLASAPPKRKGAFRRKKKSDEE
jgi:DNA topoisomerase-1